MPGQAAHRSSVGLWNGPRQMPAKGALSFKHCMVISSLREIRSFFNFLHRCKTAGLEARSTAKSADHRMNETELRPLGNTEYSSGESLTCFLKVCFCQCSEFLEIPEISDL